MEDGKGQRSDVGSRKSEVSKAQTSEIGSQMSENRTNQMTPVKQERHTGTRFEIEPRSLANDLRENHKLNGPPGNAIFALQT